MPSMVVIFLLLNMMLYWLVTADRQQQNADMRRTLHAGHRHL
jgi:hypothetical protein